MKIHEDSTMTYRLSYFCILLNSSSPWCYPDELFTPSRISAIRMRKGYPFDCLYFWTKNHHETDLQVFYLIKLIHNKNLPQKKTTLRETNLFFHSQLLYRNAKFMISQRREKDTRMATGILGIVQTTFKLIKTKSSNMRKENS